MKNYLIRFFLFGSLALTSQDCTDKCKVTNTYTYFKPVYSTSAEVKNGVRYEAPKTLVSPGRIYFDDHYLFINETGAGIHVIDNQNPAAPITKGFIRIPGNYDLVVIDNLLYADSFVDLVLFDISDKSSIKEVNRIERVFSHLQSYGFDMLSSTNLVLTDWEKVETVSVTESACDFQIQSWGGRVFNDVVAFSNTSLSSTGTAPSKTSGKGGSMARFTVTQNRLFAIDGNRLDIIDVTQPANPVVGKEMEIGWDVETLFPYKDKLFAGSQSGMYIYDLKNPQTPTLMSKYEHVRSCDPVVVDDSYAYVTLRNGNTCQGFVNQLEVINISNLSAPSLVKTYAMTNPHGLGIDNKLLFICDGADGLKVFDATNVNAISENRLAHHPGIKALDIIPYQNIAMMIGTDGLYQYDYSDPRNIYLLSKLPIVQ